MIHIVCLTKSYNFDDFRIWYNYYRSLSDNICIHVVDNDSSVDISSLILSPDTLERVSGWPNQWKLFDNILTENPYMIANDDYVLFVDDDEYFWFANDIETDIRKEFEQTQLNVLCVPQICMSTKHLQENRTESYTVKNYYRRNDFSSQGKSIILYNSNIQYCFSKQNIETGHIPFTKYPKSSCWTRLAKVIGSGITKNSTYGLTAHDANVRLYHFHIKSMSDWREKWNRGSAACLKQPYDENIHKNPGFDGYTVPDMTIKNYVEMHKLV